MLIRDFFSISLPAAFLDFWVNLGGGKDLRMQKGKTTETRKRTPRPDPCICFVWKMQRDWITRKCPQTSVYLFDIYKMQKDLKKNESPPHANNCVSPWWGGIHVGTCHRPVHLQNIFLFLCVYLICVGISYSFAFLRNFRDFIFIGISCSEKSDS